MNMQIFSTATGPSAVSRLAILASAAQLACGLTVVQQAQAQSANEVLLQQWANQTGQAAQVVQGEQGVQLEWNGQSSLDVYSNSVSSPSGNPALSPIRPGTFERLTLGGDLRGVGPQGDVNYLQAVATQSTDRSVLSRYNPQLFSLQAGRAGPGYQFAAGDVVANYSGLGANMGLRGISATNQIDRLTVNGFAGTVAESWESLFNVSPRNGGPARLTYLRDVYGTKVNYQATREVLLFGTLQSRRDRQRSLESDATGVVPRPSQSAAAATTGVRYQTQWAADQTLVIGGEVGRSRSENLATSETFNDTAVLLDAQGRIGTLALRAGFHKLGNRWASVGQTAAPGIREAYAGGDWQFAPEWIWGSDVRRTDNSQVLGAISLKSELDSLANRLSWTPQSLPGWNMSLSDLRNRTTDATGGTGENNSWQVSVNRSVAPWVASLTLGRTVQSFERQPASGSRTTHWQLNGGRSWSDATAETPASLTFSLQALLGMQNQVLALPASNKVRTAGLTGALTTGRWGSLNYNWQFQSIDPENARPKLTTRQWTLDYSRQLSDQWTVKGYWRDIRRNHGSLLAAVDERVLGFQVAYLW